jgi:dTDP-glucose pyrophosphorylase/CBS domain-containing protein
MHPIDDILLDPSDSVRTAMARINLGEVGLALVVDPSKKLVGTVSDGDVRRAILAGLSLETPVSDLLARKIGTAQASPVVAPVGTDDGSLVRTMRTHQVDQLPLVDTEGRVVGLATLDEFVSCGPISVEAVIMAGGFGTRLRPFTDTLPKPMLPVAGRPLLERTIGSLRQAGIHNIHVTTHYLPEKITDHFGDGHDFGVRLRYVAEDEPLGTAGSIGLLEQGDDPLLIINGDILTRVDFRALIAFHKRQRADMTVGVRQYDVHVPYGVIEAAEGRVSRVREKPKLSFLVNAGIYLLEARARQYIPSRKRYDMTDLIDRLLEENRPVASFPIVEYWLDVGRHDDYSRAQQDALDRRWAS